VVAIVAHAKGLFALTVAAFAGRSALDASVMAA
jgi:hypothetical protein